MPADCNYTCACSLPPTELCEDGDIRLIGGTDLDSNGRPLAGRVEYCLAEQWGTICNNGFDNFDARVICRQLGFSISESHSYLCTDQIQ